MNTSPSSVAGGRATEVGMAFQAEVGAWFASHLVARMPLDRSFGLTRDAVPIRIQFETGTGLDDIEVTFSTGEALHVQCKTRPSLSAEEDSDLAHTLRQLVSLTLKSHSTGPSLGADQEERNLALLAVAENAPKTLDDLDSACRYFDGGGDWRTDLNGLNQDKRKSLAIFEKHVRASWTNIAGYPPTEDDLLALTHAFRIKRFDVQVGGSHWCRAASALGSRLYGSEDKGDAPLATLVASMRTLIANGAPAKRDWLLSELRTAGHEDTGSPDFDADVAQLRQATRAEFDRLERHRRLAIGSDGGILIKRECRLPLEKAAEDGSLFVLGEPGAGKTGALVDLIEARLRDGTPAVFLSVDRLSGVATRAGLHAEIGLKHDLIEVLANWPGGRPGLLIIDALDASRGGTSEAVFSSLIEDILAKLGERWSVLASIRTFDLKNGRRFQEIMRGAPPDLQFSEPGLDRLRHFRVPRLSDTELGAACEENTDLSRIFENAPSVLKDLLRNVFNLSIAVELIAGDAAPESIRCLETQSDLLDRYENVRMPTGDCRQAAARVVATMVDRHRLVVRQVDIDHSSTDELLHVGILASLGDGDRVAFAHHVLFDHVAGRFFLEWDNPDRLQARIAGDPVGGLLLGPSMRFAMERMWHDDADGRPKTWSFVTNLARTSGMDPIVTSVAVRTIAERVGRPEDLGGLIGLIEKGREQAPLGLLLSQMARFVGMLFDQHPPKTDVGIAWATLAQKAIAMREDAFVDGVLLLLWAISERGDFNTPSLACAFGAAARDLLGQAWERPAAISPFVASKAIRFVAKSYATNAPASRDLLQRILEEPRFSEHAHEEAPALADSAEAISAADPNFVVGLFSVLFERPAPQQGITTFGGRPSRIMPLTSTKEQDYEQARWQLTQFLPTFLQQNPRHAISAAVRSTLGLANASRNKVQPLQSYSTRIGDEDITIVLDRWSLEDWRETDRRVGEPEEILGALSDFLAECSPEDFRSAVEVAKQETSGSSVWARLLGVASERSGIADDLLWPVAGTPALLKIPQLARDGVAFLAAVYPSRSVIERRVFETAAMAPELIAEPGEKKWWRHILGRFLSSVPVDMLATEPAQALRNELAVEGKLKGNEPFVTFSTGPVSREEGDDFFLRSSGVDLTQQAQREVHEAECRLAEILKQSPREPDLAQIAALWRDLQTGIAIVQQADPTPPHQLVHAFWGTVSNLVERIAESKAFDPGVASPPALPDFLGLLLELAQSPYPEPHGEQDDRVMGWGSWDVRVYAASSLIALAPKFGAEHPAIIDTIRSLVADPVAAVRLQPSRSLNVLWNVARDAMWELARRVAEEETNPGVLSAYLSGTLRGIARGDMDRAEDILDVVLRRLPLCGSGDKERTRSSLDDAVAGLIASLWVSEGRPRAQSWIEGWIDAIASHEHHLGPLVFSLRDALFFRFTPEVAPADVKIYGRAKALLAKIVAAAADLVVTSRNQWRDARPGDADLSRTREECGVGIRLLEHACNQIYFGSGAFEHKAAGDERIGLEGVVAKKLFLKEYAPLLDRLAQTGVPSVVHNLLELYGHVADADPGTVFDRIAAMLVGPAADQGYQFESMASEELVKLVRRYLADYRAEFEDSSRREYLVKTLEVFAKAGSPDAMRLLYDLPDLLR